MPMTHDISISMFMMFLIHMIIIYKAVWSCLH